MRASRWARYSEQRSENAKAPCEKNGVSVSECRLIAFVKRLFVLCVSRWARYREHKREDVTAPCEEVVQAELSQALGDFVKILFDVCLQVGQVESREGRTSRRPVREMVKA